MRHATTNMLITALAGMSYPDAAFDSTRSRTDAALEWLGVNRASRFEAWKPSRTSTVAERRAAAKRAKRSRKINARKRRG